MPEEDEGRKKKMETEAEREVASPRQSEAMRGTAVRRFAFGTDDPHVTNTRLYFIHSF